MKLEQLASRVHVTSLGLEDSLAVTLGGYQIKKPLSTDWILVCKGCNCNRTTCIASAVCSLVDCRQTRSWSDT